jgi:mono/diheme cytochrome c family protein
LAGEVQLVPEVVMTRFLMVCGLVALAACNGDGDGTGTLEGDPVAGEAVFASNCAICHGADGTGGSGPDVTGQSDEAEVVEVVENGEGDMPGFVDSLTEQEIADVAAFVTQSL